jgi:SAM-dependent methyltransferase
LPGLVRRAPGRRSLRGDARARRVHHPGPHYVRADLHGFDFGPSAFDAVVCLDSSLLYCHTNAQLDGFLASCRRALTPGGLLVAEMRNGAYFLGRTDLLGTPRGKRARTSDDGFEVLELHDGPGPRTEPAWQDGELPGATTDGDRLHVVARRTNTTH